MSRRHRRRTVDRPRAALAAEQKAGVSETPGVSKSAGHMHSPPPDREGTLFAVLKVLVAVLLGARLLVPPEAAVFGSTLWIVELWFVAGVVWAWDAWRRGDGRLRFDALDAAVWAVVAGHVLSALWTFHIGGDRRAALNLMWEWVALGTSFFLVRQVLRSTADIRRLVVASVALMVALAGLGVWQHYYWLPEVRREYEGIRAELHASQATAQRTAADAVARRQRVLELEQRLAQIGVPPDEAGRRMFEDRLHSTEPFGLFALANTFAAVLLAGLVVGSALAVGAGRHCRTDWQSVLRSWPGRAGFTLALLPTAYCLLLTKSRTAWAGLVAAVVTWGWLAWRARRTDWQSVLATRGVAGAEPRVAGAERSGAPAGDLGLPTASAPATHTPGSLGLPKASAPATQAPPGRTDWQSVLRAWGVGAGGGVLLIGALVWVAVLSGGLDRQVVSEAPKSLNYRWQYWIGAAGVVREHPVFGVGPGNFRQHYLKHKLPESSEEIAEPHNFVLDLWTSGGILAVAGMAVLIVLAARSLRCAPARHEADRGRVFADPLVWGTGLSCALLFGGGIMLGDAPDFRLLALLGGWIGLIVLADFTVGRQPPAIPVHGIAAACVGVLVHLLGSGGIEMPAIPQMLLLLVACASGPMAGAGRSLCDSRRGVSFAGLAIAVLCLLGWMTAAWPVFQRETLLASGEAALRVDRNPEKARRLFAEAAERDPLSSRPLLRLAESAFSRWRGSGGLDTAEFDRGLDFLRLSIEADQHNPSGYRSLGNALFARFQQSGDPADAARAAEALAEAVRRSPTTASLRGELAVVLEAAGRAAQAAEHARRALELDEINRREGHRDKYLAEEQRTQLRQIAAP